MAYEDLLKNNLFLSMLSQGGATLAGPRSVAAGINPILQGAIASQNQIKAQNRMKEELMSKLLGRGADVKSSADGKISITAENIDALSKLLSGGGESGLGTLSGATAQAPAAAPAASATTPATTPATTQPIQNNQESLRILQNLLNPSSSPSEVPAYSDLVGLTPEHISSALQMKMMQDEAGQKGIMNRLEIMKALQGFMPEQPFPIEVPGLGYVSTEIWKALPDEQKEYAAYRHQELAHGGTPLSFQEFITSFEPHERIQFLQQLAENPELMGIEKDLRASSATNINLSPYDQTSQRERAKQQTSVMAPDFVPKLRKEVSESIDARSITDMKEREGFINQKVKDLLKEQVLSAYPDAFEGTHPTNSSIKGWWTKTDDGKWMLIQRTPGE
jgi:hypothetical protein